MAHIVILINEIFLPRSGMVVILLERSILLGLPTCATQRLHWYSNKAYILKYLLDFHNKYWKRPSLPPFYDATAYNLSFNSNSRILAAQPI